MTAGCALEVSGLGMDPADPAQSHENAYACACSCNAEVDVIHSVVRSPIFNVCVPDTLNGNKGGKTPLDANDVLADCQQRVLPTYAEMTLQCQSLVIVDTTKDCNCAVLPAAAVAECNKTCNAEEVDCATFDSRNPATVHGTVAKGRLNDVPVCEVASVTSSSPSGFAAAQAPATPGLTPLAAKIFGQRSNCVIDPGKSTATVTLDGDPQQVPVRGVVDFVGAPCPGAGCAVGMSYQLFVDPLQFNGFCAGTEISDVVVNGTVPDTLAVDASGHGQIGAQKMFTSSRGTRTDSGICITDKVLQMAFLGTNTEPVDVTVDWGQKSCALTGVLLGTKVENDNALEVAVSLHGTLVN